MCWGRRSQRWRRSPHPGSATASAATIPAPPIPRAATMSDFLVDRPLGDPLLDEAVSDEVRGEAGDEPPELASQPAPGTLNLTIAENAARAVLPTPAPSAHPANP